MSYITFHLSFLGGGGGGVGGNRTSFVVCCVDLLLRND